MRYVLLGAALGTAAAVLLAYLTTLVLTLSHDEQALVGCFYGCVFSVLGIAIGFDYADQRLHVEQARRESTKETG